MQALCPICHKVRTALFQPPEEERETADWGQLQWYVMEEHEYPDVEGLVCPGTGKTPVAGYKPVDTEV